MHKFQSSPGGFQEIFGLYRDNRKYRRQRHRTAITYASSGVYCKNLKIEKLHSASLIYKDLSRLLPLIRDVLQDLSILVRSLLIVPIKSSNHLPSTESRWSKWNFARKVFPAYALR